VIHQHEIVHRNIPPHTLIYLRAAADPRLRVGHSDMSYLYGSQLKRALRSDSEELVLNLEHHDICKVPTYFDEAGTELHQLDYLAMDMIFYEY
jgi:hypothetical protein